MRHPMHLLAATIFAATSAPMLAEQPADKQTGCIQQAIEVKVISDMAEFVDTRELKVSLTNHLPFTVGAIHARFRLYASDRSIPLDENLLSTSSQIAGGLLSGESIVAISFHFMDERGVRIAKAAPSLNVDISIINVADEQMRGMTPAPVGPSWAAQPSPHQCVISESLK